MHNHCGKGLGGTIRLSGGVLKGSRAPTTGESATWPCLPSASHVECPPPPLRIRAEAVTYRSWKRHLAPLACSLRASRALRLKFLLSG